MSALTVAVPTLPPPTRPYTHTPRQTPHVQDTRTKVIHEMLGSRPLYLLPHPRGEGVFLEVAEGDYRIDLTEYFIPVQFFPDILKIIAINRENDTVVRNEKGIVLGYH